MTEQNIHEYDDIIDLPHHVSMKHAHMPMKDRAAQFSPFAALTGHSDALDETARLTSRRIELSEDEKIVLDRRMKIVMDSVLKDMEFTFIYFVPDIHKEGGRYRSLKGKVKKINLSKSLIYIEDGTRINIKDIIKIDSEIFKEI